MIKELIETEKKLRREAESYEENIMDKLKPIFQVIKTEYLNREEEIIDSKKLRLEFGRYSTLDGYRLDGESIYLHYYEYGYDCYDCEEFKIPLEVVEKELQSTAGEVLIWYRGEIEKVQKKKKELQKEIEAEKKEKELAELKRLQEKYKDEL